MQGSSHTNRRSAYSLSNDQHTPEWLCEPFTFDDVMRPPSYLYASLQQALNDYPYDQQPPAYEHTVGSSNTTAGPSSSAALPPSRAERAFDEHDSIWEDWDSDGSDGAEDADDELERSADGDADEYEQASEQGLDGSDSGSTLLDVALQGPSPTFSPLDQSRLPDHVQQPDVPSPGSHPPPPAYHLLHLHHIMEKVAKAGADPYTSLVSCLANLDAQLLAQPFVSFAEICYSDAIRGDDSPPNERPFSQPPRPPTAPARSRTLSPLPQPVASGSGSASSSQASSSSQALALALSNENVDNMDLCPPLADRGEDESEGEDDEVEEPRSPAPTFMAPPLVYDVRAEESNRHRNELTISENIRSMSPLSMSLLLSEEPPGNKNTYRPTRSPSDPAAEVACLFLSTPVATSAGAAVQCFPTRPPPRERAGGSGVRGMLYRSFNFNRMQ